VRLLIIEDSTRLRTNLARALKRLGHGVDAARDAEEGEIFARVHEYDVIVLDIMLPGRDGLSLLRAWRSAGKETPVILLTAKAEVDDRVRGLALGADDYLVKPFAFEELSARIEALGRRRTGQAKSEIRVGPLEIDLAGKIVKRDGVRIELTSREFALLECLARRPGQILSRAQIEAQLYNESESPLSNAVDAAVYALRRKLCPPNTPPLLHTRRGLGYMLGEL
jgi:two-component system copper resistance phosphate regulon response regulator CusR